MKKVITRLVVGIMLLSGMLLTTTEAQAQQQLVASDLQLSEVSTLHSASQLRTTKANLKPLSTSQYVATDINGKKHDIDAILKSGKAIMIDFSAVWCGPCWQLHRSGILEKLYAKFGPNGSNQIELFWVGADASSTVNAIKGNGGGSKGDWTKNADGKPVPYPLFSDSKMYSTLGIPVAGYPTLVLVGPGNQWIECRGEVATTDSEFTNFSKLLALFMTEADKPAALEFSGVTDLYVGETHTMRLTCSTVAPITSSEWKAPEGITLTKVSDTEYRVAADKLGSYEIKATVTNKNGSTSKTISVTVSEPIATFPFVSRMDVKDKLDKGWRSIDHDGDGLGFDSFAGKGLLERLGLYLKNGGKAGAEDSEDCLISFGKYYPTSFTNGRFGGVEINPNNELLSAPLIIPADAKAPTFSCYIARLLDAPKVDELKVMVSEIGGKPVELQAPQRSSRGGWQIISADLSAYKGKTILISLVPVVNGKSGIQVDQLRVTMDGSTDVETPSLNLQTTIYPNPATAFISVQTKVGSTIELFTIEGALVSSVQTDSETTTISVAQLPAGSYITRIISVDGETVLRPLIIR